MNKPDPSFYLSCNKCQTSLRMEDFALDTETCQNKHVFFLRCPECDGFSATSMNNIPQDVWGQFIDNDKLDNVIQQYNKAMHKS